MRYRGGGHSMGGMVAKLFVSEVMNLQCRSRWRVGNDINRCILCGKCESLCHRDALRVNKIAKTWTLNNRRCNQCYACIFNCPTRCLNQVRI